MKSFEHCIHIHYYAIIMPKVLLDISSSPRLEEQNKLPFLVSRQGRNKHLESVESSAWGTTGRRRSFREL